MNKTSKTKLSLSVCMYVCDVCLNSAGRSVNSVNCKLHHHSVNLSLRGTINRSSRVAVYAINSTAVKGCSNMLPSDPVTGYTAVKVVCMIEDDSGSTSRKCPFPFPFPGYVIGSSEV